LTPFITALVSCNALRALAGLAVKAPGVFLPNQGSCGAVLWLLHCESPKQ